MYQVRAYIKNIPENGPNWVYEVQGNYETREEAENILKWDKDNPWHYYEIHYVSVEDLIKQSLKKELTELKKIIEEKLKCL